MENASALSQCRFHTDGTPCPLICIEKPHEKATEVHRVVLLHQQTFCGCCYERRGVFNISNAGNICPCLQKISESPWGDHKFFGILNLISVMLEMGTVEFLGLDLIIPASPRPVSNEIGICGELFLQIRSSPQKKASARKCERANIGLFSDRFLAIKSAKKTLLGNTSVTRLDYSMTFFSRLSPPKK